MLQHGKIVKLFTDRLHIGTFLIFQHIFDKGMTTVQNQRFPLFSAEHISIHTRHCIHLHHILHAPALLRQCNHGRNLFVLQLLHSDFQIFFFQSLFKQFTDRLCLLFHLFGSLFTCLCLKGIRQIRINPLELNTLIFRLQLGDKRLINMMGQDNRIHTGGLEHSDILTLLLFIRHIIDNFFALLIFCFFIFSNIFPVFHNFRFYFLARLICCRTAGIICSISFITALAVRRFFFSRSLCYSVRTCLTGLFFVCCIFSLIGIGFAYFQAFRQCQIFAVQILKQNIIRDLFTELIILQAAELDKRTDIIPVLLILFFLCLAHTRQLVSHFFGNII